MREFHHWIIMNIPITTPSRHVTVKLAAISTTVSDIPNIDVLPRLSAVPAVPKRMTGVVWGMSVLEGCHMIE